MKYSETFRVVPPGVFKKPFLTSLWLIPTVLLFAFATSHFLRQPAQPSSLTAKALPLKVPIEVITADQKSKIVFVEIDPAAVPEPSVVTLLPISTVLLFFRRR